MTRKAEGSVGIHVGASKETVVAAREAILDILNAQVENKTIRVALTAFVTVCEVKNTTIEGCTISMAAPK